MPKSKILSNNRYSVSIDIPILQVKYAIIIQNYDRLKWDSMDTKNLNARTNLLSKER
jgi:hypothetical protein